MSHILIVDDDREIRDLLSRFLKKHGFRVTAAEDGRQMKKMLEQWEIDLIVLDLMLPGDDGLTLCRDLRARSHIPIIMLTALGEDVDRILGLEMGADDYLPKPCNPRELLARIRAVLRRISERTGAAFDQEEAVMEFDGWLLDCGRRHLRSPEKQPVDLTSGEFDLLAILAHHAQQTMSRDQILDAAKGRWSQPFERSIDMQVSRLRRKIERDPENPQIIKTVRASGYMFTPIVEYK